MSISREDIEHIAHLARIELKEEEIEKLRADLNNVLGYIEILNTVETEGVEPLAQVTGLENVLREDKANPPKSSGKFIKVKKVFES